MFHIFYDFETSSRDLIGQIISYAFIITDSDLQPIDTFDGKIKLNRTQCPEVDALLVNKIVVSDLQEKGISEYEAALAIFDFLTQTIASYGPCHLVGFNSNQFDLSFNYFQNIPSNTDKYCVIIEPREHSMLIKVIKNFMYLLQNKGWGLIIIHGSDNKKFLKNI